MRQNSTLAKQNAEVVAFVDSEMLMLNYLSIVQNKTPADF